MGLPPRRRRAIRICRATESCVRSMWIPYSGAEVLEWPLCRPLVPTFSDSDFEMRLCGSWRATFVRSAFIELIGGHPMAYAERTRCGG